MTESRPKAARVETYLNEHISGFTSHNCDLWNTRVGASDPEKVGGLHYHGLALRCVSTVPKLGAAHLTLDLLGHELGLLRSDLSGPVPVAFEDFPNLLELLGSYRVPKVHVNLIGGLEGFSVERHVGDAGSVYRSGGTNDGTRTQTGCGSWKAMCNVGSV